MENADFHNPPEKDITVPSSSPGNENGYARIPETDYFAILDALNIPATYITPEHRYQFVNNAFADWFGIDRKVIIGKSVKEFLGAKAYAAIKPYMERALKGELVHYEDE